MLENYIWKFKILTQITQYYIQSCIKPVSQNLKNLANPTNYQTNSNNNDNKKIYNLNSTQYKHNIYQKKPPSPSKLTSY